MSKSTRYNSGFWKTYMPKEEKFTEYYGEFFGEKETYTSEEEVDQGQW